MSQSSYLIDYGSADEGSGTMEIDHSEDDTDSIDALVEAISGPGRGASSAGRGVRTAVPTPQR